MTQRRTWYSMVLGGTLLAAVTLHAASVAGQTAVADSSPPTYAIPLRDGGAAIVWWDAVSDPAHPGWRCELSASREGGADRTTIPLTAMAGDWRAALAEARAFLKGRLADGK
jgi:hypothetical protein